MCYQPMKIKATSSYAPVFQFIPCGHCDECRRLQKSGWSFRLGIELQGKLDSGWKAGFVTLTYNEEHVPTIPFECFLDGKQYKKIYCFDKNKVRKFVRNLRTKLFDDYGITGLVYMIGSEYGKRGTCRSHHHMLVCYPPEISSKQMHGLIKSLWLENGYVSPEEYLKKRPKEENFELDTRKGAYLCAKYVCKYVCKDISFDKTIDGIDFVNRNNQGVQVPKFNLFGVLEINKDGSPKYERAYQLYLRCRPFHLQSRSLGWSFFKNMSDSCKLKAIEEGVKFLGEEYRQKLPVYIKNKLIYDNHYIFEEGSDGEKRRLCRRFANNFFLLNASKIYELKVKGYAKLFESSINKDFWMSRESSVKEFELAKDSLLRFKDTYSVSYDDCASLYLSYFGVPYDRCFDSQSLVVNWLQRYVGESFIGDTKELIDRRLYNDIQMTFGTFFYCMRGLSTDDSFWTKKINDYKQRKKDYG